MKDIVIQAEQLSKRYRIGAKEQTHQTFVEATLHQLRKPFENLRRLRRLSNFQAQADEEDIIWALKDISFSVERGEIVGIIGRNGAGKSTLLKILSRITQPTSGQVVLHGRVSSLLEVGTGFHPELTGRENVYLNGTILGMRKKEIDQKFDEIVDFSGVEKFIDTPVKRYSSGMRVRLAFAVAAHLEPEILLIDEVLAVGDAAFQRKCLGKMDSLAHSGKTVLFVSHNMGAVQALCTKGYLVKDGRLAFTGSVLDTIDLYLNEMVSNDNVIDLTEHAGRYGQSNSILKSVQIIADGLQATTLRMGGDLKIITRFEHDEAINHMRFGISIEDRFGQRVTSFSPSQQDPMLFPASAKNGVISCNIPFIPLGPGQYGITLIIASGSDDLDRVERAATITVEPADVFETGQFFTQNHGIFFTDASWQFDPQSVHQGVVARQ